MIAGKNTTNVPVCNPGVNVCRSRDEARTMSTVSPYRTEGLSRRKKAFRSINDSSSTLSKVRLVRTVPRISDPTAWPGPGKLMCPYADAPVSARLAVSFSS